MCSCKRHGDQYATCTCSCPHPAPTTPTPEDAARAVEWLYPALSGDDEELTYPRSALRQGKRDAYLRGRADERARIAARRDEVAEVVRAFIVEEVGDDMGQGMTDQAVRLTDAVLAALGVDTHRCDDAETRPAPTEDEVVQTLIHELGLLPGEADIAHEYAARAVMALYEPETVTTAAELDALPVGSVLMTPRGAAELRDASNSGGRYLRTFNGAEHFGRFLAGLLPATVLHRGGDR